MQQFIQGKHVFAIGGGKGGVGKSFLASNLGVMLARGGRQTVLIDADLGGANLHTCLGVSAPETTFSDFIKKPSVKIEDVLLSTGFEGLQLISGAQDFLGIANPNFSQKMKILRAIQSLRVDDIILDLGAGTAFSTLDFFLTADKGIIVVLPEPTSIENAYRFMKSAFYRLLSQNLEDPRIKGIVQQSMDSKNELGVRTPADLLHYVRALSARSALAIEQMMDEFRPRLVLNQVRSSQDVRIGYAIRDACRRYFGIELSFLGYMETDEQVWRSIRKRSPLMLMRGNGSSKTSRQLAQIMHNLLHDKQFQLET